MIRTQTINGHKIRTFPTLDDLIKHARKRGVKIYADCKFTHDDTICVEVKKVDFLDRLSEWDQDSYQEVNSCVNVGDNGHIYYG